MKSKASLNYLRIAPRKMRLVADMVRGKRVEQAEQVLDFCLKKGAVPLKKLLQSCVSNAKNNLSMDEKTLKIAELKVDEGPILKRWRARARGRAMEIQKKTSHITLVLEGKKGKVVQQEKKEKKQTKEKVSKRPEKELLRKSKAQRRRIFKRKAF